MEPFNAERIEAQVTADRALSVALREIGRLARVVEEQSGRIESLEGANVKRYSYPEPDAEPPYRMTRPTNRDALVIDGGKVWRPVFGPDGMWEADDDGDWVAWETFTDPQPYRNCVLTADDPEPPEGSVVRDDHCGSYERIDSGPLGWRASRSGYHVGWVDITETTVTLLYRGEA